MSRGAAHPEYVSGVAVRRVVGVHQDTLKAWAAKGVVRSIQPGGAGSRRFFHRADVMRYCGLKQAPTARETILYARVSSSHQKPDLARQVEALRAAYPSATVIQDVGSGINFRRRGLLRLLDRVNTGLVRTVVVAHKDRLCRFAHELLAFYFEKAGCRLVVLDRADACDHGSGDRELSDDLLSIVNVFVARRNGERSAAHRRARKRRRLAADNEAAAEADTKACDQVQARDQPAGSEAPSGPQDAPRPHLPNAGTAPHAP